MTHTDEALKKAFEPVEVNQIILLSDGAPAKVQGQNQVPIPTGLILEMVKGLNRLRGVKINTFCFAVFTKMGGAEPLLDFGLIRCGRLSLARGRRRRTRRSFATAVRLAGEHRRRQQNQQNDSQHSSGWPKAHRSRSL